MKTRAALAAIPMLLACLVMVHPAFATTRAFQFDGTITRSNVSGVSVGDPFVATLSYDDAQAPTSTLQGGAIYGAFTYSLTVASMTFTKQANQFVQVNHGASPNDHFFAAGAIPQLAFSLKSSSNSVFSSTALPASLTLGDFDVEKTVAWTVTPTQFFQGFITSISTPAANQPPDCTAAMAEPAELWSPDHQLVPIQIVGVTDPDGDPVTIEVTGVTQDEPVNGIGDGNTCPDAVIENGQVSVRAERSGKGNDRVYAISFTATDPSGESCTGVVNVCVRHDQGGDPSPESGPQRSYQACWDDGQNYNSLGTCAPVGKQPPGGGAATALEGGTTVARGSSARVEFTLAAAGEVELALYDLMGRRAMELDRSYRAAGTHEVTWDASRLTAGMYFYRLRVGATSLSRPVLVLR